MGLLDRFRKRDHEDPAVARRKMLLSRGRLTDGIVIETEKDGDGKEMVRYEYSVQGVEFESCEVLTETQIERPQDYAPGASIGVRYDPRNHGNSIIV